MERGVRLSRNTRRMTMKALGAAGLTVGALSLGLLAPGGALAQKTALGMPLPAEKVAETLQRLFAGRPLQPAAGRLKLDAPLIAENGAVVPIRVESALPMTADNYVRRIFVIADRNRRPLSAVFTLSPLSGSASIATNVRLAETSDVRVIAEMSNGALYEARQEVRVTVGGCGG